MATWGIGIWGIPNGIGGIMAIGPPLIGIENIIWLPALEEEALRACLLLFLGMSESRCH